MILAVVSSHFTEAPVFYLFFPANIHPSANILKAAVLFTILQVALCPYYVLCSN